MVIAQRIRFTYDDDDDYLIVALRWAEQKKKQPGKYLNECNRLEAIHKFT